MKIELCAASVEAIQLARELNFDRIELCQNLELGGTTPSPGYIEYALANGLETHVLVRPRPGGFYYHEDEVEIMYRDIIESREIGARGVVVGALNEFGEVDHEVLSKMVDIAGDMIVTFHRAFDDSIEWKRSLEVLIDCGVDRVLSSGMARNVDLGFPILKEMVDFARDSIEIMAGGGVNSTNISRIAKEISPAAIHFSGTEKVMQDEDSLFSETLFQVNKARVQRILDAFRSV